MESEIVQTLLHTLFIIIANDSRVDRKLTADAFSSPSRTLSLPCWLLVNVPFASKIYSSKLASTLKKRWTVSNVSSSRCSSISTVSEELPSILIFAKNLSGEEEAKKVLENARLFAGNRLLRCKNFCKEILKAQRLWCF